jgi:hypothetical protein
MKSYVLALVATVLLVTSAQAWNDKGHMVVARLAWKKLTNEERTKIVKFLEKHPHYDEFLRANRPANMTREEWVFLRAATWADWIKSGPASRTKFNRREEHYINLPFVQGTDVKAPELPEKNVVTAINKYTKQANSGGSQEDRAVALTWLFHLVGDIHQPLHCITLYSDTFPEGDRGGNRALVRFDGRVIQLHRFWDGLLGRSTTLSSIGSTVHEVEMMIANDPDRFNEDLANNNTPEKWAKESFDIGKRIVYLNGDLKPANDDDHPHGASIPNAPEDYAEKAGDTARFAVAKGGARLASLLKEIVANN